MPANYPRAKPPAVAAASPLTAQPAPRRSLGCIPAGTAARV